MTSTVICTGSGLPAPGGRTELSEICGHIASLPLDRSRPLWEMWVIEGVAGTDAHAGGRLAVMTKVHHAARRRRHRRQPDVAAVQHRSRRARRRIRWTVSGGASQLEIAGRGLLRFATRPVHLATQVLPGTVTTVVDTVRRARAGEAMASPFTAPQTPFNASITGRRNVAFAQLDLEDVKTVKNHFGVKLNDVVMALVSGVLRQYLLDHDDLPDSSLVAMVPVSVHGKSDRPGRNKVSGMFSSLQTDIDDPAERLKCHRRGEFGCQGTQFGDRGVAAAGLVAVRRTRRVRCRDAAVRQHPADRGAAGAQPGGVQCARARRCRCTSWAPRSRRCIRSGRSSTGRGSTSP